MSSQGGPPAWMLKQYGWKLPPFMLANFERLAKATPMSAATPLQLRASMKQQLALNLTGPRRTPILPRGPKTDWAVSHNKERMDSALSDWMRVKYENKKNHGIRAFCHEKRVAYTTFQDRLRRPDPFTVPKRGRPHLFSEPTRSAIVDCVAALDHLNKGKSDAVTSSCTGTYPATRTHAYADRGVATCTMSNHTHTHTHIHIHTHTYTHIHTHEQIMYTHTLCPARPLWT
jgi:hypothetical protein